MKHALSLTAALLALAACDQGPATESADADAANAAAANATAAAPVELPPAIKAEKTLRCRDNSLVYVTFFQGDKQAVLRTEQNGASTTLRAENAGDPLTAEGGYSMNGTGDSVSLTVPGKSEQTCHV